MSLMDEMAIEYGCEEIEAKINTPQGIAGNSEVHSFAKRKSISKGVANELAENQSSERPNDICLKNE
jgi:hypothetical protein